MTLRLIPVLADSGLLEDGESWVAVSGGDVRLGPERRHDVGSDLEAAFAAVIPELLSLCHALGADPSAVLAHTPSAAANASDLGLMMAWSRLAATWAREGRKIALVCSDPWLYRHLAGLPGVVAAPPPPLPGFVPGLRGVAARLLYGMRTAWTALLLRAGPGVPGGGSWLMSYANPQSDRDGGDAYFGSLMRERTDLRRVLHVDCSLAEARRLSDGGRGFTLHGWGSAAFALLRLPFMRWRPRVEMRNGPWGWLVRRAAAREAATAQGAAIAWQIHCQRRWLKAVRPSAIAWPWENHGWERDLVRAARSMGISTAGYQHSSVGRFELNYHADGNPDGAASLPDQVLCVGGLSKTVLTGWGVPEVRCRVAGALRYGLAQGPRWERGAPIFVALPGDTSLAARMVQAACRMAHRLERRTVIRPHPVYDVPVPEDALVRRAPGGLGAQEAVSAVIYAATTVGLEAVLFGLPTIRFIAAGCIAHDILPNTVNVPTADEAGLATAVERAEPPPLILRDDVFAPVDHDVWRQALPLPKAAS